MPNICEKMTKKEQKEKEALCAKQMLKSSFRNYFKNFKYIFVVMGVVYLAFIITVGFILMVLRNILVDASASLLAEIIEIFTYSFTNLSIADLASGDFFSVLTANLTEAFTASFAVTMGRLLTTLIFSIAFMMLAFKAAGFLCKVLVRIDIKNEKTRKGIVAMFIRYSISSLFVFLITIAVYHFFHLIYVMLIVYLFILAISHIIEIKLIYFPDQPMKKLLTAKNIFLYILAILIFFFITLGLVILLSLLFNLFIAVLIGIPFFIYFTEIIKFTLVEYFREAFTKKSDS